MSDPHFQDPSKEGDIDSNPAFIGHELVVVIFAKNTSDEHPTVDRRSAGFVLAVLVNGVNVHQPMRGSAAILSSHGSSLVKITSHAYCSSIRIRARRDMDAA
jgi:hypothetical protein